MNINFPNSTSSRPQLENAQTVRNTGATTTQGAVNANVQQGNNEVSFNDSGVQALKTQLASANLPSVRQERVQALRLAVQDGSYNVSNQQIAQAIHSDLFGPSNS